jgi:phenol hydroxylase P1 protein
VQIDIKTTVLQPSRQTFDHIARRLGDRPASRYEEATLDLQWEDTFHYRPLWAPEHELFDKRVTRITMQDWYAPRDPRQYYYATYNIARSKQIEAIDRNFDMVESRGMLNALPAAWRDKVNTYLLPLRHYEWGANMNNANISTLVWGAVLSIPTAFHMADRLGNAQLIGRIGLAVSDNGEEALNAAKALWMSDGKWVELRHIVEDSLVIKDPIEQFVVQNLAMDGIVHPLVFGAFSREGDRQGGAAISFLTGTVNEWIDESNRWVDHVVKTLAAENADNRTLIKGWLATWSDRAAAAVAPLAEFVMGQEGRAAVANAKTALADRAAKLGLG